jgi:hypothetical protein
MLSGPQVSTVRILYQKQSANSVLGVLERQRDRIAARTRILDRHRRHFVDSVCADPRPTACLRHAEFFERSFST